MTGYHCRKESCYRETAENAPEEADMTGENNLRETLLAASGAGTFLETVYAASLAEREERGDLAIEVAALHNEGLVDVVAAFEALKEKSANGPDFFLTRYVFEKALPHLDCPVASVMRCVVRLYKDAGTDMAAGMILSSFIKFCAKDAARPKQALEEIEADPAALMDLLVGALVAGSRLDSRSYLAEAVRLGRDNNAELRRRAVFAIGRMKWPDGETPPEEAFEMLEHAASAETDDEILAGTIKSSFELLQRDKAQEQRVVSLMKAVLKKGGDTALHAASQVFSFDTKDIPDSVLDVLLFHLRRVKAANTGTINMVDYGIAHLIKGEKAEKGLRLLQDLLLAYPDDLDLQNFDSALLEVRRNKALTSKVLTRWFLHGEPVLCEGVDAIVSTPHDKPMHLEIDPAEIGEDSTGRIIFLARKTLGWLLFKPVSAAGVLISLMRFTGSDEARSAIGDLLLDPLLLNYTGSARAYVEEQSEAETGKVKDALKDVLKRVEDYLNAIRSIDRIPELHPGEAQRQTYHRRESRMMVASMKKAEAQSPFLSIIQKSVLLYGRTSINYIYAPDGQMHRSVMPLHSFGTEFEIPRYQNIDPFSLDYMLRLFRAERLRA